MHERPAIKLKFAGQKKFFTYIIIPDLIEKFGRILNIIMSSNITMNF